MPEEKSLPIYTLPKYRKFTNGQERSFEKFSNQVELFTRYHDVDEDKALQEKWREVATEIVSFQTQWFKEVLGLDVSTRLQDALKKLKLYTKNSGVYSHYLGWAEGGEVGVHFAVSNEPLINLRLSGGDNGTMEALIHELFHATQRTVIDIRGIDIPTNYGSVVQFMQKLKLILGGYTNKQNGKFLFLTESVNTMMTLEFRQWYEHQQEKKYVTSEFELAYSSVVIILDLLLKQVAEKTNKSLEELWHELYRGATLGDFRLLRMFEEYISKGILKLLGTIDLKPVLEGKIAADKEFSEALHEQLKPVVEQLVEKYGFDASAYESQMEAYMRGEVIVVGMGIKAKKNPTWKD